MFGGLGKFCNKENSVASRRNLWAKPLKLRLQLHITYRLVSFLCLELGLEMVSHTIPIGYFDSLWTFWTERKFNRSRRRVLMDFLLHCVKLLLRRLILEKEDINVWIWVFYTRVLLPFIFSNIVVLKNPFLRAAPISFGSSLPLLQLHLLVLLPIRVRENNRTMKEEFWTVLKFVCNHYNISM